MGSGVGTTIGSGVYVTSNRDDKSKGLAAIDYAGGKFTSGKAGIITEFTPTDNVLIANQMYLLDDLIERDELAKWFKTILLTWKNNGWYKKGLKGGSIVQFIQSPPPGHGKKQDIGKAGFDAVITLNSDGTIYEAAITNITLLNVISQTKT